MRATALAIIALSVVCHLPGAAQAEVEPPPLGVLVLKEAPKVGNATTIVTEGIVTEVTITYSPSSNVVTTETVKANGTPFIVWRPQRAGVAEISAPGHATKRVSIRFDGLPLSGLFIMLFAATVLFGGALLSLRALLATEP